MAKYVGKISAKEPTRITEDSGFHDPIRIENQRPKDQPKDGKESPWDFRCPQYDQRSSNFINAGTHYGIGRTQPVGHKGNPAERANTLPMGRPTIMRDDEKG
jgi:hypothetical protein